MNSPVACVQRSQIIYADSLKTHFSEGTLIAGKRSPLAYSLLPATIKRATDATRISSLVLSPGRHGAGRRRPRALGRAASCFSDQRGRREIGRASCRERVESAVVVGSMKSYTV